ncbi:hypothetical protein [Arsukibacterium indicum]|jgi:hypothetical protein|uniref:HEPN AbiU2-like domain-containing protein n=1 Tax=Arsukibacterium indicum TaxID=2848612 RepID=A0ABS6MFJ6_9GAMM|nr:hypothetical protein [Arsukibacterium indicum]MBV2127574.1 hypothetical protein [Arsukibacterium indicum]
MEEKLAALGELQKNFESVGRELFEACEGQLFPADALFLASCNRALQVLHGFMLILRNNGYSCGVALLRIQLDSILRLHGITLTADPHDSANKVIQGEKLSKIKDKAGRQLSDAYLVDRLTEINPWLKDTYRHCSSYIHLSDTSFHHLLDKSEQVPNTNERKLYIGSDESEIAEKYKIELIQAFSVATEGIQKLTKEWTIKRHIFGCPEVLKKQYTTTA